MRRLHNNVNLYEPQNTLYALKFPAIIVMEAQNKRVLLKIILHCHGQPVRFVLFHSILTFIILKIALTRFCVINLKSGLKST